MKNKIVIENVETKDIAGDAVHVEGDVFAVVRNVRAQGGQHGVFVGQPPSALAELWAALPEESRRMGRQPLVVAMRAYLDALEKPERERRAVIDTSFGWLSRAADVLQVYTTFAQWAADGRLQALFQALIR